MGKIGMCTLFYMCSLGENSDAETAVLVSELDGGAVVL
jgi:hypothetical protein